MQFLYVEDNTSDAELTQRRLRRLAPQLQMEVVSSLSAARQRLEQPALPYAAVMLDLRLPDGDGLELLNDIRRRELPLVVVILTGSGDEETAVSALKAGADDYVIKQADYLSSLPATLEQAVRRFRAGRKQGRRISVLYAEIHMSDTEQIAAHLTRHAPYIQLDVVASDQEVLERLDHSSYDVLLIDYGRGRLNALDLVKRLAAREGARLPVVLIAGQGNEEVALQALKLGAADYVVKGPNYLYRLPGVLENAFHMAELEKAYDETIEGWARAMDLRDHETEGHSKRMAELGMRLAEALGVVGSDLVHMRRGALLHDIGKMGIPDGILLKPGPLDEQEWAIMRQHPAYAYQFINSIEYLRPAVDIPYCHHERIDGTGYPRGLKGDEIPLSARIFAVVDVWEALNSDRAYRKAWPREQAVQYLRDHAGSYFDPAVVEVFLRQVS